MNIFLKQKNMISEIDIDKNDVEKTSMLNLFKWYRLNHDE